MISIVKIGNLEIKKKESGDSFRAYFVFDGDEVVLDNAQFKEAVDYLNRSTESETEEVDEKDLSQQLPPEIEAVFLYDRDSAIVSASLTREEAESVFKEEVNCIPKIGSTLMMSPDESGELTEKTIQAVEFAGQKTLIIYLGGT